MEEGIDNSLRADENYLGYKGTSETASVVQWSEFLATDTEVSGSIPGATRFF